MVLFALWKKRSFALILFLTANPLNALNTGGNEGVYRWKNRGCVAVFRSVSSSAKDLDVGSLAGVLTSTEKQTFEALVRENPDKIAAVAGLFISSCLLYHSLQLARDITRFYGKFKELRQEFDEFIADQLPKIQQLAEKIQDRIDGKSIMDAKEQERMMFVLVVVHAEVVRVLRRVRGLIEEALVIQQKSRFLAAVSFGVGAIAAIALSPVVAISDVAVRLGMGATVGIGATAGVLSLMNVHHCEMALEEMREYEKELGELHRNVVHMKKHFEKEALYDFWALWFSMPDEF